MEIRTVPVANNLYVLAGGGGNIALSVGEDGALLVDGGFEQLVEKITTAVGTVSTAPIRLVVNTHWHFDHVGGNEKLAKVGATIVAHEDVRKLMSEDRHITVIDSRVPASPAAALPVITFTDSLTFHWNGDEVRVLHVPPAHTDGDSIVYFRNANVLHVGDTWFNGMYPFIDVNAGGSLDGLVRALDRALALANEKTKIIPGHGPLSNAVELKRYRDMLATVRDRVRVLLEQGKSRAEVIAAKPTNELDGTWGNSWLDADTWVGLIYDGMSRK
jgi:glyoxylase-like metal-dependent hydrolase (beta-lactamase superfamily II)